MNQSAFETKLKTLRKIRGLSLKTVAQAVGVTAPTVLSAEKGNSISLLCAINLARFYQGTIEEIWSQRHPDAKFQQRRNPSSRRVSA